MQKFNLTDRFLAFKNTNPAIGREFLEEHFGGINGAIDAHKIPDALQIPSPASRDKGLAPK